MAHTLQLQEEPFQFFNKVLKYVQIFVRFYMGRRKLFENFGPKLSKLLVLMVPASSLEYLNSVYIAFLQAWNIVLVQRFIS